MKIDEKSETVIKTITGLELSIIYKKFQFY